jgi:hypothetical protein
VLETHRFVAGGTTNTHRLQPTWDVLVAWLTHTNDVVGVSRVCSPHAHRHVVAVMSAAGTSSRVVLTAPVVEFIAKSTLPRLIDVADDDPEEAIGELGKLLIRLRAETVSNPALASLRCEGLDTPFVDSRASSLLRNDVTVVAELVRHALNAIRMYFSPEEDPTDSANAAVLPDKAMIEQATRAYNANKDDRRVMWPYRNVAVPTLGVRDSDLTDRVAGLVGVPIDDAEFTAYCRRNLLAKGADLDAAVWSLVVGRVMAWETHLWVVQYKYSRLSSENGADVAAADRLAIILTGISATCTFERSKDLFLTQTLRAKLHAERIATLEWGISPLRMIPDQYGTGEDTNKLVRPYIEIAPKDRGASIQYKTDRHVDSFMFSVSVRWWGEVAVVVVVIVVVVVSVMSANSFFGVCVCVCRCCKKWSTTTTSGCIATPTCRFRNTTRSHNRV